MVHAYRPKQQKMVIDFMRIKQSLNTIRLNGKTSDFIVSTELLASICFSFTILKLTFHV